MKKEIKVLDKLRTRDLVEVMNAFPGRKYVKTNWALNLKSNGEGAAVRPKVRQVAKRLNQGKIIDFQKVFSPTSKYATKRPKPSLSVRQTHQCGNLMWRKCIRNCTAPDEDICKISLNLLLQNRNIGFTRRSERCVVCVSFQENDNWPYKSSGRYLAFWSLRKTWRCMIGNPENLYRYFCICEWHIYVRE